MNLPINKDKIPVNFQNLPAVYIAGKVTGLPYDEVLLKFKKKQRELEGLGFFVLNPTEIMGDADCDWKIAMRVSVILLANADHICLLPDWHLSPGATLERELALKLGISTIDD